MDNKELAAALRIVKRFVADEQSGESYTKCYYICNAARVAKQLKKITEAQYVEVNRFVQSQVYPHTSLGAYTRANKHPFVNPHSLRHEFLDKWIKELEA